MIPINIIGFITWHYVQVSAFLSFDIVILWHVSVSPWYNVLRTFMNSVWPWPLISISKLYFHYEFWVWKNDFALRHFYTMFWHWAQKSGLTLTLEHVTWKSIGIIYLLRATPAQNLVKRYWADTTVGWENNFDLDLWTGDLESNRDHLLIEVNPCTKFGIDQMKGSKDIKRTIHWAEKSDLILAFEHVS